MKKDFKSKSIAKIGEYLVCAELAHRGYAPSKFTANTPEIDLIVTDKNFKTIPVSIRTIKKGKSFYAYAHKWIDGNSSINASKKKLLYPKKICVLAILEDNLKETDFFVLKEKELRELYFEKYMETITYTTKKSRNPYYFNLSLNSWDLKEYLDNWGIFKESFSKK